ncbi:MAG: ATP-binding protein [Magnetospirillum sp.]|nr:ATP-binding protein [Magnetospirillum sp.]
MLTVAPGGVIAAANVRLCRLLRTTKATLVGRRLDEVAADSPDKVSRMLRLFSGGTDWLVGALSLRRPDGSITDFPCQGALIRPASAAKSALVGIRLDESRGRFNLLSRQVEALNAEIRLRRQAEAALREADRRKDEFLAILGHELRNPLAPMSNAVQFLKLQREPSAATTAWAVGMMERQIGHLTRIVDDLLDVVRITQGRITLLREPVDLSDVVQRASDMLRPLIDAHRHTLTLSLPTEPLIVEGDGARLVQVVGNLLDNSAKYTEDGGRIDVALGREGDQAVLWVRDNGSGIPTELMPHVFEMFVHGARPGEGLGIGLNLCRRMIEMHRGTIAAASAGPGQGSTFTVRLPLARLSQPRPAQPVEGIAPKPRRRVLVVDDNIDVAQSFAVLLDVLGHDVRTAGDGPSAIEAARTFQPDIVFIDIGLPGMDGYEVAKRLRAEHGAKPRLVAITGYGQPQDRERSLRAGIDKHLVKPVYADALEKQLATLAT